jgi:hypothetical protein
VKQPWYRSSAVTFTAGLVGLALIAGLVMAVVQMSGRWSTSDSETVISPGAGVPEPPHFAGRTSVSAPSTSYTTSVQLSTTDIGAPTQTPTSSSETSSSESPPPESPTPTPSNAVAPTFPGTFPTRVTSPPTPGTTRPGPRINVTRTLYPMP